MLHRCPPKGGDRHGNGKLKVIACSCEALCRSQPVPRRKPLRYYQRREKYGAGEEYVKWTGEYDAASWIMG